MELFCFCEIFEKGLFHFCGIFGTHPACAAVPISPAPGTESGQKTRSEKSPGSLENTRKNA